MSQSDYLKYKKTSVILKQQTELPNILAPQQLTEYKAYSLENTVINTLPNYRRLVPTGKISVFDMVKKVSDCPQFIVCSGTKNRPYRKQAVNVATLCQPIAPIYKKKTDVGSGDIVHTKYCNYGCPKKPSKESLIEKSRLGCLCVTQYMR